MLALPLAVMAGARAAVRKCGARIARALNDAGIACPSAADPGRNPHRTGTGWTLDTITAIVRNPRYTGRQVWNRQRTDRDLADAGDIALGHNDKGRPGRHSAGE